MQLNLQGRVLPTIIVTYLLVFTIPLAGSVVAYMSYAAILKENIVSSNLQNISVIREEIDSMVVGVEALSNDIAKNEYVRKYLDFEQPLSGDERIIQARLINDQTISLERLPHVIDYYIYFLKSDKIIHSTGAISPYLFYQNITSYEGITYTEWLEDLQTMQPVYRDIKPAVMHIQSKRLNAFNYIQTLPVSQQWKSEAVIVVLLDINRIEELLSNSAMGGYSCVLNAEGELMVGTGDSALMPELDLLDDSQSQPITINGQKMIVVSQRSEKLGWRYVSVIPERVFLNRLDSVRKIMYLTYAVSALFGITAAGFFAYRSYRPIRIMAQALIGRGEAPKKMNEYDYIASSITSTLRHNRMLEKRIFELSQHETEMNELINKNSVLISHNLLNCLLDGRYDDAAPILEWLDYNEIRFKNAYFTVMLVCIEDSRHFVRENNPEDIQTLKYAITSIAEELASEYCFAVSTIIGDSSVVLILNPSEQLVESGEDFISSVAEVLEKVFDSYFDVKIKAFTGHVVNDIRKLPSSYGEATAKTEATIETRGSNITSSTFGGGYYKASYEKMLSNAVQAGDLALCEEVLESIFRKYTIQGELMKNLAFYIVGTATKVLDLMQIDMNKIFPDDVNLVQILLEAEDEAALHEKISYMFREICDYIASNKVSRSIKLRRQIIEFIDKNIHNTNLSQTLIAEKLEISSSYLSKLFKKESGGINMVDYINKVRIDKVKELLINTNQPLEGIATQVGYTNSKTLIRVFKQHEGVTPGKFRSFERHS